MNKNPDIVVDSIIGTGDSNGNRIYPISILRYAWLERLGSPFIDQNIGFSIDTLTPTAFVFTRTSEELRKYGRNDADRLVEDAFIWADNSLSLDDFPEIVKSITKCFQELNKASPDSTEGGGTSPKVE